MAVLWSHSSPQACPPPSTTWSRRGTSPSGTGWVWRSIGVTTAATTSGDIRLESLVMYTPWPDSELWLVMGSTVKWSLDSFPSINTFGSNSWCPVTPILRPTWRYKYGKRFLYQTWIWPSAPWSWRRVWLQPGLLCLCPRLLLVAVHRRLGDRAALPVPAPHLTPAPVTGIIYE